MHRAARSSDLTLLGAAFGLMVGVAALSFVLAPQETASYDEGSSYAASPSGAKAAYVLLEEAGYDLRRSFDPLASLRADPERSVVLLINPQTPPSGQDVAALGTFVEAGGIVLATGPSAFDFLPGLRPSVRRSRSSRDPRTYTPTFPSPLTKDAPLVSMRPLPRAPNINDPAWMLVYGTRDDPAILTRLTGTGRIVWWASSHPLSNAAIASPGHLELLLNIVGAAGQRTILWDEHYHGHSRSLWSYAAGTPVPWAALQLSAVGVLALFTYARRHGPLRPPVVEPRTSPLEFIDTMGSLYARARPAHAAVATSLTRARRLLHSRAGLPASSTDAELARALEGRFSMNRALVEGLLTRASHAAGDSSLPENDALQIVRELQMLSARLAIPVTPAVRPALHTGAGDK